VSPRALGDSVRPRVQSDVYSRPHNFTVRPMSRSFVRFRRLKTMVVVALAVLALITWFRFIALTSHFDQTRPTHPDAASGRVYPQNTHGSIVYLNASEQSRLRRLSWGSGLIFLVAVLLGRWWQVPRRAYWHDLPKDVRDRLLNNPSYDYEKARATYDTKSDSGDAGPNSRWRVP